MPSAADKYNEPIDEIVEHYAKIIVEDQRAPDLPMARLMVDTMRDADGLLGRITQEDVAKGYSPRYVRLRALTLAGIATEREQAEWAELIEDGMGETGEVEPQMTARPAISEEEMQTLREHLWEIRRLTAHEKELKKAKATHSEAALPILRTLGSVMIADPIDGKPRITNVIEAETLQVDAGELLTALNEHYQDEDMAYLVWKDTLKPPAVDIKDDGLFHQATRPRGENGELPALIPPEVVAKVASFKKSAAYIGFARPGAKPGD